MKVVVVGGGAREHVIAETLARDAEIYSVMKNRNPGIASLAKDVLICPETQVKEVKDFAVKHDVDLAVIGPESALEAGIVDYLRNAGIPAAGPDKAAARIETSKIFMRELMEKYNVPGRARHRVFDSIKGMKKFIEELGEVAVKPVGLTGGKGVKVMGKTEQLSNADEAVEYAKTVLDKKIGGAAKVVIEERLKGEELTIQAFCDGKIVVPTPAAQDHPHAYEGDTGPITGGMGSYSQADGFLPFLSDKDYEMALETMQKTIDAMRDEGTPYHGILYGQFVLTKDRPRVVEFNARFGDPEAMNVLPLLNSNFADICMDIAKGTLDPKKVKFRKKATVCKYVVPKGYGVKSISNKKLSVNQQEINNLGAKCYFASVNSTDTGVFTTSSRSVGIVGFGDSIDASEKMAEEALRHVTGEAIFIRHDIAKPQSLEKRINHMREVRKGSLP